MSNSKHDKVSGEKVETTSPKAKSGDESEEECEVLEESPCGRWQKRREEVQQRDVPGIDCAFLAMDTEEGVEVVWNEVQISEKKSSKVQLAQQATAAENVHEIQEKIKQVFDNLIELEHPNIAKFHKYWMDTTKDRPRVIFITEYMSSGSLRQFLRKTKRSNRTLKAWKRWCTQILSALSYLHCCEPPIIHGNLTTDTIFIQHNGLIKIGSVAPDAIYNHVKTYREEVKNVHYAAPEYAANTAVTTAVDVYSFGICALEMAAMELPANGDAAHSVADDVIVKALESIEDHLQKDFIAKCLEKEPKKRPTARELLFHPVLFEVHSLKLLSAHKYIKSTKGTADDISSLTNFDVTKVLAEIPAHNGHPSLPFSVPQSNILELEKFLEDVRNGVYPLTAFGSTRRVAPPRVATPEQVESVKNEAKETVELENRRVIRQSCQLNKLADSLSFQMTLLLRMDDQMNRQLTCEFTSEDTPKSLAHELVGFGFINADDIEQITGLIKEHLSQADKHLPVTVCQE